MSEALAAAIAGREQRFMLQMGLLALWALASGVWAGWNLRDTKTPYVHGALLLWSLGILGMAAFKSYANFGREFRDAAVYIVAAQQLENTMWTNGVTMGLFGGIALGFSRLSPTAARVFCLQGIFLCAFDFSFAYLHRAAHQTECAKYHFCSAQRMESIETK